MVHENAKLLMFHKSLSKCIFVEETLRKSGPFKCCFADIEISTSNLFMEHLKLEFLLFFEQGNIFASLQIFLSFKLRYDYSTNGHIVFLSQYDRSCSI